MSALAHEMCRGAFFFGGWGREIRGIRGIRDIRGIRGLGESGEEFDFSDSYEDSDFWLLSLGDEIFLVLKGDFYQKKY